MNARILDGLRLRVPRSVLTAAGLGVLLSLPTRGGQERASAPPRPLHPGAAAELVGAPALPGYAPSRVPPPPHDPRVDLVRQEEPVPPAVPKVTYSDSGLKPGEAPAPGATVELDLEGEAEGGDASYQWVQIEGPRVEIAHPDRRAIEVEVPEGAERLAFLRLERAPGSVRVVRFVVPVKSPETAGPARADAGDDQVGLVGHRVTLNGSKSLPASGGVFRWIQVAGPPILAPQQDRAFYSFVPTGPGLYQFALVVGGGRTISDPDGVSVLVVAATGSGLTPAGAIPGASAPVAAASAPPAPAPPPTPAAVVASALPGWPRARGSPARWPTSSKP